MLPSLQLNKLTMPELLYKGGDNRGALDGGVPMSRAKFKKRPCRMSLSHVIVASNRAVACRLSEIALSHVTNDF